MPTVRFAALAAGLTALCLLTVAAGAPAQGGPEDVQQQAPSPEGTSPRRWLCSPTTR